MEQVGPIATVVMSRPPVNAVDEAMYRELRDGFNRLACEYPSARIALLRSDVKHFCAGNDLGDFATMTPENAPLRMQGVREAFWAIHDCPLPVIAVVHGVALGTGLAIAASADMIICSNTSSFGLPELSVGVLGGARHLARLVPQQLVRRMFFTADSISGAELAAAGGAVMSVPEEDLLDASRRLAERIARHSPSAIKLGKRALNQIEAMDLKNGYELEQGYTGDMSGLADAKEALAAFRERRTPAFAPARSEGPVRSGLR